MILSIVREEGKPTVVLRTPREDWQGSADQCSAGGPHWVEIEPTEGQQRLVGVWVCGALGWKVNPAVPTAEELAYIRDRRQLVLLQEEPEPLGWFALVTDVHDVTYRWFCDFSRDSDVLAFFAVLSHHCWGEYHAVRYKAWHDRHLVAAMSAPPLRSIEELMAAPNVRGQ